MNRDKAHNMAAWSPAAGSGDYFVYKLCQNEFELAKAIDLKNSTSVKEWGGSSST